MYFLLKLKNDVDLIFKLQNYNKWTQTNACIILLWVKLNLNILNKDFK